MGGIKNLPSQEIANMYQQGKTAKEVGESFNCDPAMVSYYVKKLGFSMRSTRKLNHEYIVDQYKNGRSMGSISKELGTSDQAVYFVLKQNKIPRRKSNSYFEGKKLVKNTKRFQILNGYKIIYTPFHPFATKHGYVCEHRLVMEKYIKRFLNKEEVIHHKNGIKLDNRPENLLLTSKSEHSSIHSEVSDFIKETGKRKCNKCLEILSISKFTTRRNKPYVYAICKSCVNKSRRINGK